MQHCDTCTCERHLDSWVLSLIPATPTSYLPVGQAWAHYRDWCRQRGLDKSILPPNSFTRRLRTNYDLNIVVQGAGGNKIVGWQLQPPS